MKAKEIILLILIIGVGILFHQLYTGEIDVYFDFDDDAIIFSNEFDFEDYQEFSPPFPSQIQVVNSQGNIDILGTDENQMTVTLRKKIWRRKEDEAKEIADRLKMEVEREANRWIISTTRHEFKKKNFRTNLVITIPSGTDVEVISSYGAVDVAYVRNAEISNRHGEVIAEDIAGELRVDNSYRDVEVGNIGSDLYLESDNSHVYIGTVKGKAHVIHRYGKVEMDNISKEVTVEGSHSEIYGEKLTGPLDLETSYRKVTLVNVGSAKIRGHNCDIDVKEANGYLDIQNNYGKVWVTGLQGNLMIDGKNLEVKGEKIVGEMINIKSSYRDIELSEFSGRTTVTHSNGKVTLAPYPLTHTLEVKGNYATIELSWPLGKKYLFEAQVKNGKIEWGLEEEISIQEEDHTQTLKAFLQEAAVPSIFLSTSYRTIRVNE